MDVPNEQGEELCVTTELVGLSKPKEERPRAHVRRHAKKYDDRDERVYPDEKSSESPGDVTAQEQTQDK